MTTNGNHYTTNDRRQKLSCDCGCGQEATLPSFLRINTENSAKLILPGCVEAHNERMAAQRQLREVVTRHLSFWQRVKSCGSVYRLQRSIFDRQATGRRTAFRSAVIYLVGTRVGLWVSLVWRKA